MAHGVAVDPLSGTEQAVSESMASSAEGSDQLCAKGLAESSLSGPSWQAQLALTIASTERGARLIRSRHSGPLYVQKPFYPEGPDLPHIYILHPPAGLVSGDHLAIDVELQTGCGLLLTTPGAGRVYRARVDQGPQNNLRQHQSVRIAVAEHSSAEWFPLETIVYPGAQGQLSTRIELQAQSQFLGWEICCLGLPASDAPFDRGQLSQRFEIYQNDELALIENLHIDANNHRLLHGKAGLQGFSVNGLFIAGPFGKADSGAKQSQAIVESLREIQAIDGELLAVTAVGQFILVRYLGHCAQRARQLFVRCWPLLRQPLLGRDACAPRIWST